MITVVQGDILSLARQRIANLREIKEGSNEWHGACPICSSDDDGFMCWPESNNYWCRSCGATGFPTQFIMWTQAKSWQEAQALLGINNSNSKHPVIDSEIVYKSRAHYAAVKGVPESVFINAKFSEIETYQGRPAMKYVTYDSKGNIHYRVRFMDGKSPKYKPVGLDVPVVWYRLHNQALGISNKQQRPLVIVNGETSVLVAQYYGIPAFCRTGGEMSLTDELLAELQTAYKNSRPREILIALDCDSKGRTTAKSIEKQLIAGKWTPTILDLGFADKGDFADFCQLHTKDSGQALESLLSASKPVSLNAKDASKNFTANIINKVAPEGKILMMPFEKLHRLGGDALFMLPRRMTLLFSMSGHFKTAFWETMIDKWLQKGHSGLVDGPEIDEQAYHLRRVLRYAGTSNDNKPVPLIDYNDVMFYQKHLQEERDNVPKFQRQGKAIFDSVDGKGKLATLSLVDKFVASWKGHLEYTPHMLFIEDKIAWMKEWISKRRADGESVEFAVFDYVQLMAAKDNIGTHINYQYILFLMKAFAMEMNIHVIAVSQVNKQPSKQAKENNKRLMVSDMSYINDRDANLSIALNFFYVAKKDNFDKPMLDDNGDPIIERKILSDGNLAALVDVLKNTHGKPLPTKMPVDAKHLLWIDKTWG